MLSAFQEICHRFSVYCWCSSYCTQIEGRTKWDYKQVNLCDDFLAHTYDAHKLVDDVAALQKLWVVE